MDAVVKTLPARNTKPALEPTVRPSREEAEAAVRVLLRWAGENPAREGLIEALTEAGASVEAAGCGTCVGITNHLIPGDREVVISSANRNFKGRQGSPTGRTMLMSPLMVAAAALTGEVSDARKVFGIQ